MTKYQLEEFKQWLEEKPERKQGLDWKQTLSSIMGNDWGYFLQGTRGAIYFDIPHWQPYVRVVKKWKAEVDQRERERERESREQLIW